MRVGRNETCPCGSGKKYKACCADKHQRPASRGLILLGATFALIAAAVVIAAIRENNAADRPAPAAAPIAATPRRQPPGPAPAGKVWSPEHGHWHDAAPQAGASPVQVQQTPMPAGATSATPFTPPATPQAQPPGPAPAGKVWSAEHGHWHDAQAKTQTSTQAPLPPSQ